MSHNLWWILSEKKSWIPPTKKYFRFALKMSAFNFEQISDELRWGFIVRPEFPGHRHAACRMLVYLTFESPSWGPQDRLSTGIIKLKTHFKKSQIPGWIDRWRYTEIYWFIYQRRSSKWTWSGRFASQGYHRGLSFNYSLFSVHVSDTLRAQYHILTIWVDSKGVNHRCKP